jgi:hypothetical protein
MLEAKSAITLALACCLLPALSSAAPKHSTANIRLELSLRRLAADDTDSIEFIARLGTKNGKTFTFSQGSLRNVAQSFESICDEAREFYRKRRHMA